MTDSDELDRIGWEIHDQWFDVDGVVHDRDLSELRVTIYPGVEHKAWIGRTSHAPREPLPPPIGDLVVRNATEVTITDEAGIGWFDFDSFAFDPSTNRLRLRSNFPLEISIQVEELDVELIRP